MDGMDSVFIGCGIDVEISDGSVRVGIAGEQACDIVSVLVIGGMADGMAVDVNGDGRSVDGDYAGKWC